ncbi:MAG: hypothetical protein ACLUT1_07455 [Ruminococcus sp.]|nr:hypothetical protein [Ruminococcus sp.]DAU60435.1 MAG TPA: hypothetical protein [Caudoviricetes sp.]
MTAEELLIKVKIGIGITGTYQDETLLTYIEEVKNFLLDGGVLESIVNGSESVGVITRGVSDLWNYGAGSAEFSTYFIQRATQLAYKRIGTIVISSSPGSTDRTVKIMVSDSTENAHYRYKFTEKLPNYNDDLSDWAEWDGNSEIITEGNTVICVVRVTTENLAVKAGVTNV